MFVPEFLIFYDQEARMELKLMLFGFSFLINEMSEHKNLDFLGPRME